MSLYLFKTSRIRLVNYLLPQNRTDNLDRQTDSLDQSHIENQDVALWQFIVHSFYNTFRALVSIVLLKIRII